MELYPMETLPSEQLINADKQILANTDYNMLKAFEHVLQADSLPELLLRIQYIAKEFKELIELRQHCREEINAAELKLPEEEAERQKQIEEYMAQQTDTLLPDTDVKIEFDPYPVDGLLPEQDNLVIGNQNEELQ